MEDEVKIELKYCERCGGLFLRRFADETVYCASCAPEMRQMAAPPRQLQPSRRWHAAASQPGGVACA